MRLIGPGMVKVLPVTALCMGLAAVAATGLPPFGLFFSELTILNGGFAAGHTVVSTLVLACAARGVLRHPLSTHAHSAGSAKVAAPATRRGGTASRPWG
jgi:formate hydrogenlyase subunit 3/multisubunit Na+/H+ antiporter MnhD subunit